MSPETVAVLGLGTMGQEIARRLAETGWADLDCAAIADALNGGQP